LFPRAVDQHNPPSRRPMRRPRGAHAARTKPLLPVT
jgi:hypothetical protein